jgi:BMFP domain-containing protein YqiC
MSQTTTIPELLLPRVREGLYALVASICETADHAAGDPDRELDSSTYREIRRRLEGAWSLLDVVGWTARENFDAVRVDVEQHREALLAAIETMVPMMAVWLRELEHDDPCRWQRSGELRALKRLGAAVAPRRSGGG